MVHAGACGRGDTGGEMGVAEWRGSAAPRQKSQPALAFGKHSAGLVSGI